MSMQSIVYRWLGLAWLGLACCVATFSPASVAAGDLDLARTSSTGDLMTFHGEVSPAQAHEAGIVGMHTLRFSRVRIDPELLVRSGPKGVEPGRWLNTGGLFSIEPFNGERYQVRGRRIEASLDGTWSWVAEVLEHEHSDFVLTVGENGIYATLRAGPVVLEVQTGNDGWHYVREPDVAAYGGCAAHGEHTESFPASIRDRRPATASSGRPESLLTTDPARTVDVLVLYSPAAANRYDIVALINNAAAAMNAALFESGVDGAVRVIHYHELAGYTEPSPLSALDLTILTHHMLWGSYPFSSLSQLMDEHDADIAHFIFDASAAPAACGWGFILTDPYGDTERAYSLSGDECFSSQNVFAHEIGHTLGGRHDVSEDPLETPYEFSHGYSWSGTFQTILGGLYCTMQSCTRLNRWSNPDLSYLGSPTGAAKHANMAASLDLTIPVVASYQSPESGSPGTPGSVTVINGLCYELNWLAWDAASGTVGWYEVEGSTQSSFFPAYEIYRGPLQSLVVNVSQDTYIRVRACNGAACGAWSVSSTQATYTNGCL